MDGSPYKAPNDPRGEEVGAGKMKLQRLSALVNGFLGD
jgi:hypothetical protein